jgi:diguanylate cyclase (GGDEF)-like protein
MARIGNEWTYPDKLGELTDGLDTGPQPLAAIHELSETMEPGARATVPNQLAAEVVVPDISGLYEGDDSCPDTPLVPALPLAATSSIRATVTIMSGLDAGRSVTIHTDSLTVGRGSGTDLCVDDPGISRRHARVRRGDDGAFYVEDLGSTNGTFVSGRRTAVSRLVSGDYIQLGATLLLRFVVTDSVDETLRQQVYESSIRDPLTRAHNRKYLADRLETEVAHARRSGEPLSLLMIDVDHFKNVNDRHGHLVGDRVLCFIAAQVQQHIRVEDTLARYGGEEFVVLARGSAIEEATQLAERLRAAIEDLNFAAGGAALPITVSIGVAGFCELDPADDSTALVALADARLYHAKMAGRNRVVAKTELHG